MPPSPALPAEPRANHLPYPVSTLSPKIVPQDLTSFKSRGIGKVEKDFQLRLMDLHESYLAILDDFHWNKLVYESRYQFEPVLGETYHLYEIRDALHLSLIAPHEWRQHRWIGSFQLTVDAKWKPVETAADFHLRDYVAVGV